MTANMQLIKQIFIPESVQQNMIFAKTFWLELNLKVRNI